MKGKILIYVVCTVLLMSLLATGCSIGVSEQSTTAVTSSESSPDGTTSSSEPSIEKYGVTLDNLDLDGTLDGQYSDQSLTIPVMSGDFESAIDAIVPIFEELSGAEVVVESIPGEQFMDKVQLDMNSTNRYDVILSPIAFLHGFAEAGKISVLTETMDEFAGASYDADDFLSGLADTYGVYKGQVFAIPYKPDVELMFYRKDLFEDQANQEAFKSQYGRDLEVPVTNADLLEVAEFFTKSINPNSPVDYGYVSMMIKGSSRLIWINRGADDVDADLMPNCNNEAGLEALNMVLELKKYAPNEWLQMGWDEANTFFANGNAAIMEQWPGLWNTCQSDTSAVKGNIGVAVTPGKTPTLGGWGIAINASSEKQELAWKFIEFSTSKAGELLKIEFTMDPCRASTYEIQGVQDYSPLYSALMESFTYARTLADADVPYISSKLNDIMELHIQSALTGTETPEQALAAMEEEFLIELRGVGLVD